MGKRGRDWNKVKRHLRNYDSDIDNDKDGKDRPHALFLLAHDRDYELDYAMRELMDAWKETKMTIIKEEWGQRYRKRYFSNQNKGFTVEHFGYADGLSNPWITNKDTERNDQPKSNTHWNPVADVKEFIIQEPNEEGPENNCGSYLVYRKYEQDVKRFQEQTKALADKTEYTPKQAGALVIGRHQNGLPLALTLTGQEEVDMNDFTYKSTDRCPFFAHTRKVNDRKNPKKTFRYPILRRGITYGERSIVSSYNRELDMATAPSKGVGLLFMSFQDSISKFQNILKNSKKNHIDPLLGTMHTDEDITHNIPQLQDPDQTTPFKGLGQFIRPQGGYNLYVPSIIFFKELLQEES